MSEIERQQEDPDKKEVAVNWIHWLALEAYRL